MNHNEMFNRLKELLPDDFQPIEKDLKDFTLALFKTIDEEMNRRKPFLPTMPDFLKDKK
jgi:hypothetical protein